jgi:acyl-coenzyme A synthetase/AMP-(fatty) acid ligase
MNMYQQSFEKSLSNPDEFWKEQAKAIKWFAQPSEILGKDKDGFYRWFRGGRLNTSYLALDYHVENGRGDQAALIYDSPVTGVKRTFTYRELRDEVALFAGVLKSKNVQKGDTVVIYMSLVPEVIIAMLACARIGAIHSVVFGGFAARELAIRIDDAKPRLLLATSGGKEMDKIIPYMSIVNEALQEAVHKPDATIILQRPFVPATLTPGRDFDWMELRSQAQPADYIEVDAWDPLYILYTSGTTGKPKGIIRDHGGHAVALKYSMKYVYDVKPGEVFWAASDVGWVVGHSYIVYAPLLQGCTTVLYEGKPVRTPDAGAFWRVISEHKVSVLFTAPTAFRAIKKEDPDGKLLKNYDMRHFRYLFLAGERCDVATYEWAKNLLGVPVIDHWWQTESGWAMLANMAGYGLLPVKPGSATKPVCGYDVRIVDLEGNELPPNKEGAVVVKLPLPPGCLPNLWNNTERFVAGYLREFPGYYFSEDAGYKDTDGYVFITGRMDDIINVAGHRLSTASMEEVVAAHPAVAECAVIGVEDDFKGQVPVGFVVLKAGIEIAEDQLEKELIKMVRDKVGPIASFKTAMITERLPKTRSGKILRNVMRNIADGKEYRVPSTIEDPRVLDELKLQMENEQIGIAYQSA